MNNSIPITQIPFSKCNSWKYEDFQIVHDTKRYFSIVCFKYNGRERIMINQPEVGILGFILTENSLDRKWLVQNKPEPGNTNYYQLAPSVQATKSNYQRAHGGKKTIYLEYFLESKEHIINIEQSEQGSKFVNKFNLNSKCFVPNAFSIDDKESFMWLSSKELKEKLREDFRVNTDARSVITAGHWHLLANDRDSAFKNASLLDTELSKAFNNSYLSVNSSNISQAKSILHLVYKLYLWKYKIINFKQMKSHYITDTGIYNYENIPIVSYFDINFLHREVPSWQQPLLLQNDLEYCVLFYIIENEIAYFYVQAYPEIGFHNRVEFGPSLQTGDDELKCSSQEIINLVEKSEILVEIDQSDEGGRFFQNITRYTVAELKDEKDKINLTRENGIWLSMGELEELSISSGKLTNELRTAISLLLSYI